MPRPTRFLRVFVRRVRVAEFLIESERATVRQVAKEIHGRDDRQTECSKALSDLRWLQFEGLVERHLSERDWDPDTWGATDKARPWVAAVHRETRSKPVT